MAYVKMTDLPKCTTICNFPSGGLYDPINSISVILDVLILD